MRTRPRRGAGGSILALATAHKRHIPKGSPLEAGSLSNGFTPRRKRGVTRRYPSAGTAQRTGLKKRIRERTIRALLGVD